VRDPVSLSLTALRPTLAICRLEAQAHIPKWATGGALYSLTRTDEELSLVVVESAVPEGVRFEGGWRCLKVEGPLDFNQTGVLASLAGPLAAAAISIFAVSTFDTDYLLVKADSLRSAIAVLREAGHDIQDL